MLKILLPNKKEHFVESGRVFANLYFQVTGEKIRMVSADDGKSDLIVLGSDADSRLAYEFIIDGRMKGFGLRTGCDDYAIRSFEDGKRHLLFLASGNVRSAYYVVYDYFERACSCHYFWDGDRIPKRKTIPLSGLDILESPRFEYRGLRYFAHRSLTRFQAEQWDFNDWKREFDWVLKKRLNLAMLRIGVDDLFQKAFPDVVPYPDYDKKLPEAIERSYNDRSLFWSLEYRGELRRKVLAYGRSLGLFQPEDCGTMTHWYSRTPNAFLNNVNPSFMPQDGETYGEKTGLVWDIRKDENLDRYFKLTDAHVKEYGSGEIFHTIGLAERFCFYERDANMRMKLYAYRRIIGKLREKYPHAPLLIGSWDFTIWWHPDDIANLIAELDTSNTLILDYTSDMANERRSFRNWNISGKFPWIFGIFHAYESSNEIRGMYPEIERRLPSAAADPMCRGLVFWPENSHQDTLMLDFFPSVAWKPEKCRIAKFVPGFCARRYAKEHVRIMEYVWQKLLPLAGLGRWGTYDENGPVREVYPEMYFTLGGDWGWNRSVLGDFTPENLEYFRYVFRVTSPLLDDASDILMKLPCAEAKNDSFLFRDVLDIARTVWTRVMAFALADFCLAFEGWRNKIKSVEKVRERMGILRLLGKDLTSILESSEEFSLFYALEDLKRKHQTNPNFEYTLKGNAENSYCRSFIYELSKMCYEPALDNFLLLAGKRIDADNRCAWISMNEILRSQNASSVEEFYSTTLSEMKPDPAKGKRNLPVTLKKLSKHIQQIKQLLEKE